MNHYLVWGLLSQFLYIEIKGPVEGRIQDFEFGSTRAVLIMIKKMREGMRRFHTFNENLLNIIDLSEGNLDRAMYKENKTRRAVRFSPLLKHSFAIEYHVHIWRVSPQHDCIQTRKIWPRVKESKRYFLKSNILQKRVINRRIFSTWTPVGWGFPKVDVWIIPSFRIRGHSMFCMLSTFHPRIKYRTCFMCHHELWPTSVSHPFSSFNSPVGLAGGKYYQKITIPIFEFVLQNFAHRARLLSFYSFLSLSFLLTFFWLGWYCNVWLYFSPGN